MPNPTCECLRPSVPHLNTDHFSIERHGKRKFPVPKPLHSPTSAKKPLQIPPLPAPSTISSSKMPSKPPVAERPTAKSASKHTSSNATSAVPTAPKRSPPSIKSPPTTTPAPESPNMSTKRSKIRAKNLGTPRGQDKTETGTRNKTSTATTNQGAATLL